MSSQDGSKRWAQNGSKQRGASAAAQGCTLRSTFQTHSLLLKPLPCILGRKRKQNKPWNSVMPFKPMLGTPYLPSFPLTAFWNPQTDRHAAGGGWDHRHSSAHTCVQDTEHAPDSSPARFQGEKSFPESRLELSLHQQWMSFILDPFQSI